MMGGTLSDGGSVRLLLPSCSLTAQVVLTDDQDQLLNSTHPRYMPALDKWFGQGGLQLRNFVVSTSVCCPSRVNLLTGRYAHNTNVTGNVGPPGEATA